MFIDTVACAESQCLPHSQEREGLVFIRGHHCYLEVTEHWGAERAEGGSKKPFWNVRAGRSYCGEQYSWKADCSIIQHNSLSLGFNLPSIERGVSSLSSPTRREAEGLRRLG